MNTSANATIFKFTLIVLYRYRYAIPFYCNIHLNDLPNPKTERLHSALARKAVNPFLWRSSRKLPSASPSG